MRRKHAADQPDHSGAGSYGVRMTRSRGRSPVRRALCALLVTGPALAALAGCTLEPVNALPTSPASSSASALDPSAETPTPEPTATATPTASASPAPDPDAEPTEKPEPEPEPVETDASSGKRKVVPFVTTAYYDDGVLTVSAVVNGITEDDGACTLTATRKGTTRAARADAVATAQATGCGTLEIPGSKLSDGAWTITVAYASDRSLGESAPQQVEVDR